MTKNPDPALVLQRAWSVFRLANLQAVVHSTIIKLEQLNPHELLGRELSNEELGFPMSPVGVALTACSEELRCESGITRGSVDPLLRGADSTPAWTAAFDEALDQYRRAASQLLQASFDVKPTSSM